MCISCVRELWLSIIRTLKRVHSHILEYGYAAAHISILLCQAVSLIFYGEVFVRMFSMRGTVASYLCLFESVLQADGMSLENAPHVGATHSPALSRSRIL